jgi:hypothetical protein
MIILVGILLLIVIWLLIGKYTPRKQPSALQLPPDSLPESSTDTSASDTMETDTAVETIDTAAAADEKPLSVQKQRRTRKRDTRRESRDDSLKAAALDSILAEADSSSILLTGCDADTVAPWVYPDPSGGLHYTSLTIQFVHSEPCSILWKLSDTARWTHYTEPFTISETGHLYYYGIDSCGNAMEVRDEYYEIERMPSDTNCPSDMTYISVGTTRFCIDKYEWPNTKGARPASFVSIYHAMDSCFTAGKRLCTSDEWTLACTGPQGWRYPYGSTFEPRACVTSDTVPKPSGAMGECRGYFDVYDMSGNLAEWTQTPSVHNSQFYNVMGGFYNSGPQSGCFDTRYSYYPQNRHNPVGFRCCKDVAGADTTKEGSGREGEREKSR